MFKFCRKWTYLTKNRSKWIWKKHDWEWDYWIGKYKAKKWKWKDKKSLKVLGNEEDGESYKRKKRIEIYEKEEKDKVYKSMMK